MTNSRLDELVRIEQLANGGMLTPAREEALRRHREQNHAGTRPRVTCSWCRTMAEDRRAHEGGYLRG